MGQGHHERVKAPQKASLRKVYTRSRLNSFKKKTLKNNNFHVTLKMGQGQGHHERVQVDRKHRHAEHKRSGLNSNYKSTNSHLFVKAGAASGIYLDHTLKWLGASMT